MTTSPLARLPALASTGVGSLPFTDVSHAVSHVADAYEVPFCPQLPRRDGDMVAEWLGSDPGHCGWSADRDRERPAAWDAFLGLMRQRSPAHRVVKLQVTGPVTLAIALERGAGRRGLGPDARALAAEISAWLAASAAAQVRELDRLGLDTLLVVDEPGLASAGLGAEHATVWDPLRSSGATWGLHVCGAVPWRLVEAATPDVLSFDVTRDPFQSEGREVLSRLTARGGRIIWGVLDPVRPGEVGDAAARLIAGIASLWPTARATEIADASLASASCGSGRLSLDGELRLAATLGAVVGAVRDGLSVATRR
jgi:hypothetical protein